MMRPSRNSIVSAVTVVAIAVLVASGPSADERQPIRLAQAWAAQASRTDRHSTSGPGAKGNGAMYLRISNQGKEDDALIAARSDASSRAELYEQLNEGGVISLRPRSRIVIPAGGKVDMRPNGNHIRLVDLTRDLGRGDKVTLTLTFEKAGSMSVRAPVL
jgi:copper(I)-binding protein